MIVKTLSGAAFLDEPYGGVYSGRSFLVCGRSGTGKTTLGFQFIQQGLRQDERCLILSTMAANDLTILAESLGFTMAIPIDKGHLILLEYQSFIPGRGASDWGTLPPDGFNQLKEIIEANSITRVMLDTVLPWISVNRPEQMAQHVFSFVRSLDRLGVTTIMTLPKPVSNMAFRLKKSLEDVAPISVLLSAVDHSEHMTWQTVKYLGEKKSGPPLPYGIKNGVGIAPLATLSPSRSAPPDPVVSPPPRDQPVRFSSVINHMTSPSPAPAAPRQAPPPPDQPARLSSVWKPDPIAPSPRS